MVLGKLNVYMWKNEIKYLSINVHINQCQIDQGSQHKNLNSETVRGIRDKYTSDLGIYKVCMNRTLITQNIRPIINKRYIMKLKMKLSKMK